MKYLLVLAVVALAYTLWKHNRQAERQAREQNARRMPPKGTAQTPANMVRCRHCGLVLPESEAVKGQAGHYCGHEHQRAVEG
jgi:uncharacterized protein